MAKLSKGASRGPMIHVRLDEKTHWRLKIVVAQDYRESDSAMLFADRVNSITG
jgi:hypothetical protein